MNLQSPWIFWHWAISATHQQVAVAAFLKTVTDAHLMVYYASDDVMVRVVKDAAHILNLSIYPIQACILDNLIALRRAWAWIGTEQNANCQRITTLPNPPRVILCLSSFESQTCPSIPDRHRFYVTNMPIDVRGPCDSPRAQSRQRA